MNLPGDPGLPPGVSERMISDYADGPDDEEDRREYEDDDDVLAEAELMGFPEEQ
jgi:hypothetical protein